MDDNFIFRTKRDLYGNVYYLKIDFKNKVVESCYNIGFGAYNAAVEITKKGLRDLRNKLESAGFTINYT